MEELKKNVKTCKAIFVSKNIDFWGRLFLKSTVSLTRWLRDQLVKTLQTRYMYSECTGVFVEKKVRRLDFILIKGLTFFPTKNNNVYRYSKYEQINVKQ